jgi:DNA-binding MarR family transcriptional regulator
MRQTPMDLFLVPAPKLLSKTDDRRIDIPQPPSLRIGQTAKEQKLKLRMVREMKTPHRSPFEADDSILSGARLLSRTITAIYDEKLRPLAITASQFVLLDIIGHAEPATRAEIARIQHLEKSTLTRNLRTILSAGWAEEVRENADGRSRPLALTATGKELRLAAHPIWLAAKLEVEELLGQEATIAIISTCDRIGGSTRLPHPAAEFEQEGT